MAKSKQIYARIDSGETIAQLAKECERRSISRPDFVREAVELHLKNNDFTDVVDARDNAELELKKANDTNNGLEKRNGELADARDVNANQRLKFKQKLEEVVQMHEKLISEVREMQSCGVLARASKLRRFNTAKYVIHTEEDNETSA